MTNTIFLGVDGIDRPIGSSESNISPGLSMALWALGSRRIDTGSALMCSRALIQVRYFMHAHAAASSKVARNVIILRGRISVDCLEPELLPMQGHQLRSDRGRRILAPNRTLGTLGLRSRPLQMHRQAGGRRAVLQSSDQPFS